MKRVYGVTLATLLCWSLAAAPTLAAADEPKQPDKAETKKEDRASKEVRKSDEKVPVYTNDDLTRMYGGDEEETESGEIAEPAESAGEPAAGEKPKEAAKDKGKSGEDALKWLEERKARQADKDKRVAEAAQAVDAAQRKVTNLETQLLAARNPFSKRPELSEEERERRRDSAETAAQRYERTQQTLAEARTELEAAEENLRQVRSEPVDPSN